MISLAEWEQVLAELNTVVWHGSLSERQKAAYRRRRMATLRRRLKEARILNGEKS